MYLQVDTFGRGVGTLGEIEKAGNSSRENFGGNKIAK